jgi:hypothetical protein
VGVLWLNAFFPFPKNWSMQNRDNQRLTKRQQKRLSNNFQLRFEYLMYKVAIGFPDSNLSSLNDALDVGFSFHLPKVNISADIVKACAVGQV